MTNMDNYTVRYWIGPSSLKDNKYYKEYKWFLESIKDLLPAYTIEVEDAIWLYCSCPIRCEVTGLMERWNHGMFHYVTYEEFEL